MDQRRILIKDFEEKIESTEAEIRSTFIKAGEFLFNKAKKDTRSVAQDDYDTAKKQLDSRQQYEGTVKRIHAIMERLQEISKATGENRTQIDSIEQSNLPVYEKLGETAFVYVKKDSHLFNQYSDVFMEVKNQNEDIENIEQDIESIQSNREGRKFFEKIADTGQMTYLKGVRMIRAKTMPRLYREAGKKLTETNFLETTGNDDVLAAAKPYLQNKDTLEELKGRQDALGEEKKNLDSELAASGVDKRPEKRIDELQKNIAEANLKYEEKLLGIAEKIRDNTPEAIQQIDEYTGFISQVEESEKKIDHYRENITKLEAAIEVDNLARQIERMHENIADHKQRIKEHESGIEDLKKKIAESEDEKKRYEEIRGPEEITLQS